MKIIKRQLFSNNTYVPLKSHDWLNKQRVAGKIAAQTLKFLEYEVLAGTTRTPLELNNLAEDMILKSGGSPTFKGYKGFPTAVCISINNELVHGIPKDITLQDGDIISFDLGVTYEHAIADTAITCIYGKPKSERHISLIKTNEEALMEGIKSISIGKNLGIIGNTIYKYIKNKGFEVVSHYGGHGLSWDKPHDDPFVSNKAYINDGIRIVPGLSIAIEPMSVIGSSETKTLSDNWTVVTNGIGCHHEHSVFVHNDYVEIITDRTNI